MPPHSSTSWSFGPRLNLLRAHGSPTQYCYIHQKCRCAACRGADAEYSRDYHRRFPDKVNSIKKKWYLANPEKVKATQERWDRAHPEIVRAIHRRSARKNKEKANATMRAYRKRNRKTVTSWERNYHAREKGNGGSHSAEDVAAQYERQNGKCFWCKKKLKVKYHVDHVVPLLLKGGNGPENLVIACPSCNTSKQAKHPMDFAGVMF